MRLLSEKAHLNFYIWSVVVFAASINWSAFMMSFMVGELFGVFLLQPNWAETWQRLKTRPAMFLFPVIFFIALAGLVYTQNTSQGWSYVIKLLPIFALPLIFGASPDIPRRKFKFILFVFVFSTFFSTFFNLWHFFTTFSSFSDLREVSFFMSHIRYSLFINMAISICVYLLVVDKEERKFKRYFLGVSLVWLSIFLFLLQSVTGIVVFLVLFLLFVIYIILNDKRLWVRIWLLLTLIVLFGSIMWMIVSNIHSFYNAHNVDKTNLDRYTKHGNEYDCNLDISLVENGNLVYMYFCEAEVREAWNKRSPLNYDGNDKKGQQLRQTLVRYITSRGLRKDREGVEALSAEDITNIENGLSNYKLQNRFSLNGRIYQIIWEIDVYFRGGNPTGNSITQRFEFLRCAVAVIMNNTLLGVGTGDIRDEMNTEYDKVNTKLEGNRYLPHNQYVNTSIRFGFLGLLIFLTSIFFAILLQKKQRDFLVIAFITILFLSMINEDTLETQYGVILYAFWGSLLLFVPAKEENGQSAPLIK